MDEIVKNKNKLIIFIPVILLIIAGFFYFSKKLEKTPDKELKQTEIQEEQKDEKKGELNSSTTDEQKNYEITLNKKDGDFFSIPDEVTFKISPSVDKSKLTLTNTEGRILYSSEAQGSEAKFTVFPEKKVMEGSRGLLILEGIKDSKVVVTKKIEVVF